jgi:cytochrome c oxidase subunit 3
MARVAIVMRPVELTVAGESDLTGLAGGPPSYPSTVPAMSNARLGLLMFLGAEAMFFAGLIGSFLVFRLGSEIWPPLSQPRLPLGVTGVNTFVLLLSGWTAHRALNAIRNGESVGLVRWLGGTAMLGILFLCVQGYEWVRLVHFGLTVSSGIYGSTFYTLIGFHGLHVLLAAVWLLVILIQARQGRFTAGRHVVVETFTLYWTFVVGLWPLLFTLVYLI